MEKAIREQFDEKVLEEGLKRYGVELKDSELIGGFENMVYEFTKDEERYVIRISHSLHNSFNNVSAELEFINHLKENGAPVVCAIPSTNGKFVEMLSDSEPCFMATAFRFAEGDRPGRDHFMNPDFLREYGKNIALMHKLTKGFEPTHKRYQFEDEDFIARADEFLPKEDKIILERLNEVMEEISKLDKNEDNYGLIHTDVHPGNFYVDSNNAFTIFDFDDCCYKHFISDIAIVLFYTFFMVPDHKEGMEFTFRHVMKGYKEVNQLPSSSVDNVGLFLQLRTIVIYIVLQRSFDQDKRPEWVEKYLEIFRPRIIKKTPYVDLDFSKIDLS